MEVAPARPMLDEVVPADTFLPSVGDEEAMHNIELTTAGEQGKQLPGFLSLLGELVGRVEDTLDQLEDALSQSDLLSEVGGLVNRGRWGSRSRARSGPG